jgi:hypothetical protein
MRNYRAMGQCCQADGNYFRCNRVSMLTSLESTPGPCPARDTDHSRGNGIGLVVAGVVHASGDRIGGQRRGGCGTDQRLQGRRGLLRGIPSGGELHRRQAQRHAIMNRRNARGGIGDVHRTGLDALPLWILPVLVETGEHPQRRISRLNAVGLFTRGLRSPLEIAAGRDQAAPAPKGGAKRRLGGHRLSPGVERAIADLGVLGPGGDQPPAKPPPYPALLRSHRGQDRL